MYNNSMITMNIYVVQRHKWDSSKWISISYKSMMLNGWNFEEFKWSSHRSFFVCNQCNDACEHLSMELFNKQSTFLLRILLCLVGEKSNSKWLNLQILKVVKEYLHHQYISNHYDKNLVWFFFSLLHFDLFMCI